MGFVQDENMGGDNGKIVRLEGDVEPRDMDDA